MSTAEQLISVGFTHHQSNRLDEAENAYQEALKLDENNAEIYNLLGVLKLQKGEVDSAIKFVEKAVEISPQEYFYETLFQAYIRNKDYNRIIAKEKFVMKLYPENFSLLFNLAFAYKNVNEYRNAINLYEKALNINPSSYNAWFNLAHLYSVEGETNNAVSAMKVCKKLKPNDAETDYFLSLALMRIKDYKEGLRLFEKRFSRDTAIALQHKSYPNKVREDNLWHGENIKDKKLLLYYEAGFGDTIMFARYLPLVAKKCKEIILICQKPLTKLFNENPQLGIGKIYDSFVPEQNMDFDVHAPLLSLPYILGLKGNDVFYRSEGYLKNNYERNENMFKNDRLNIAIKWQGNTAFDKDRVIPANAFVPLTEIAHTQFYSFQTFEGADEVSKISNIIDVGKDLIDFSQTARALVNIDLVICNDTSLAHLAGAMGIPCWILLPYEVNWRWHTDLSVCDWYDNVRLFRQKTTGNWDDLILDVKNEMEFLIAKAGIK